MCSSNATTAQKTKFERETDRNAPVGILSSLALEEWTAPAFEVFVKWLKQPQKTIPEDADIDMKPVHDHIKLWEFGRKLQAPKFQNAVMKNLIYLTDFYEEVTAADMLWLYSRIAGDDDFQSFDDHKMFKFCLDAVAFDAPEDLWKDVIRQGGELAVMVAEDVFEDDTDEKGNLLPGRRDLDPANPRQIHLYLESEGSQHMDTLENDIEDSETDEDHIRIRTIEIPDTTISEGSRSRIAANRGGDSELTDEDVPPTIGTSNNHDGDFDF